MLAFSIFVLAFVVYVSLRRLGNIIGAFGLVVERTVNRAAMQSGQPPITTPEDEAMFR